jgi:hypothetical protein
MQRDSNPGLTRCSSCLISSALFCPSSRKSGCTSTRFTCMPASELCRLIPKPLLNLDCRNNSLKLLKRNSKSEGRLKECVAFQQKIWETACCHDKSHAKSTAALSNSNPRKRVPQWNRARICKRLRSPGIDLPGWESIPGLLKRFTNTGSTSQSLCWTLCNYAMYAYFLNRF